MMQGAASRRTVRATAKSRYTLGGWLLPKKNKQVRIYQPTYQLTSKNPFNYDHIQVIIRNCIMQEVEFVMPIYDPTKVMRFARDIADNIKFRIQIQNFDRTRAVVIVNVTEKALQGINWQVGTLLDSSSDAWTSFDHETPTYYVNVFVAGVYWD